MINLDAFNSIKSAAETNTRIFTPKKIVKEMLEALPPEVWNSQTVFFDPAVKSGIFLVEIFNKLMETPSLIKEFPDQQARKSHILKNQMMGIATDKLSCLTAQRNIYGYMNPTGNIRTMENYMDLVKNKSSKYYVEAVQKEFGENMKFDVIIGNPPYQEGTGGGRGNRADDIFHKFIEKAMLLDSIITMIVPSKWCNKDSLTGFREKFIADNHIEKLVHFENSKDCFDVDIAGGVSYFIYNPKEKYSTCSVVNEKNEPVNRPLTINGSSRVILNNIGYSIIEHVKNEKCFVPASGDNPFKIRSDEYGDIVRRNQDDIRLIKGKEEYFFRRTEIAENLMIDQYKCSIGKMNPDRGGVNNSNAWNVINVPKLLDKGDVIAQNYMILYASDSKEKVSNFMSYAKSKFFRFLLLQGMSGVSLSSESNYIYIQIQDFSHPWTDEMLYKKYNLTDEEIAYIEATIKPM